MAIPYSYIRYKHQEWWLQQARRYAHGVKLVVAMPMGSLKTTSVSRLHPVIILNVTLTVILGRYTGALPFVIAIELT